MAPKVSVIIPVYNNERYVRRCVESVLGQTLTDIEVICVNDGSTDSSQDILHEYADKDERVTVIDKENSGYGANLNIGFKKAAGDFITILESDDFAEPVMLEKLYQACIDHDLEVARANFNLYWSDPVEKDVFLELFLPGECNRVIDPSNREDQHCFYVQPAIWSAIYKRSFIEENSLDLLETPGAAYQDTSFNFKVWACAERVMFLNEPFVHYRQDNEASSINNPGKVYSICDEYKEIERWLAQDRPDLKNSLTVVANKMKFDAYTWNCGRLAEELRLEFAQHTSEEFGRLHDAGLLDPGLFSKRQWGICLLAMKDPVGFCQFAAPAGEELSFFERNRRRFERGLSCLKAVGPYHTLMIFKER